MTATSRAAALSWAQVIAKAHTYTLPRHISSPCQWTTAAVLLEAAVKHSEVSRPVALASHETQPCTQCTAHCLEGSR